MAQVPHRPSSGGASLPLGLTREYPKASGQLLDLRLTPYIPYPPPPPALAAPVPVTQTLLGDEWLDLQQPHSAALGEVKVGVDWTVSFEMSLRSTVPKRAAVRHRARRCVLAPQGVAAARQLQVGSMPLFDRQCRPKRDSETSDIMTDVKFMCVGGRRRLTHLTLTLTLILNPNPNKARGRGAAACAGQLRRGPAAHGGERRARGPAV